jgi:uncharacterized membrane protein YeaQ/YmgE (transglycosylase-associated protein family)
VVTGLIIGALARLVMPGKQSIGVIMTDVLGAAGSLIGTWLTYTLGYSNANGGFKIIPFLVGIIVAVLLIAAYLGIIGRRGSGRLAMSCSPERCAAETFQPRVGGWHIGKPALTWRYRTRRRAVPTVGTGPTSFL